MERSNLLFFTALGDCFASLEMTGKTEILSLNEYRRINEMAPFFFKRLLGKIAMIAPGGYTLRPWLHKLRGVNIGKNVWISQYVYIDEVHPENITIKDNVSIGIRSTIFAHFYSADYEYGKKVGKVVIKKDVYIGPHCVIVHDVTINEGSVIAAGSVVSKNVPSRVLYGPPSAAPLAKVTRPLIKGKNMDYKNFLLGLKKLDNSKKGEENECAKRSL